MVSARSRPNRLLEAAATTGCDRDRARNFLIVGLLASTGLRLSELLDLRWDDVMLDSERLDVRSGKGLTGRSVPLASFTCDMLRAFAWPGIQTGRCFVVTGTGCRLSSRAVQHLLKRLGQRCAIRVSPHSLRHTFARRYLTASGGDLVSLARVLGHSSIATTARYARPSLTDEARRLDALHVSASVAALGMALMPAARRTRRFTTSESRLGGGA